MRTSSGASKRLRITVTRSRFIACKTSTRISSATKHFEDQSVHVSRSCNKVLGWLHRLVGPWLRLRGSHVLGFRRWRWLFVRYVYDAPPLSIGVKAPE